MGIHVSIAIFGMAVRLCPNAEAVARTFVGG